MSYTITGSEAGKAVTASRLRPASAGVLAQKWIEDGRTDVRIEWAGRSFDLAGFLAQFVLTRAGMQHRSRRLL